MKIKQRPRLADNTDLERRVRELFNEGFSNAVIAEIVGLPASTLAKLRRVWNMKHDATSGRRWTNKDDVLFIKLWNDGVVGTEIAKQLSRSYGAYASRLKVLKAEGKIEGRADKTKGGLKNITTGELEAAGIDHYMLKKLKSLRISGGSVDRNFSLRDMVKMYKEQQGLCYYTQLRMTAERGFTGTNISLDRLDNTKNYTVENTVMCCSEVNRIKGQLSIDELDWWVDKLVAGRE